MNKYVGRSINQTDFKATLLSFFDNGSKHLVRYIPVLIEKIKKLYSIVEKMATYRFYSSSLLIIYDASWDEDNNFDFTKEMDLRMIDFANSVYNANDLREYKSDFEIDEHFIKQVDITFPPTKNGPDGGYLKGLNTLRHSFEEILKDFGDESYLQSSPVNEPMLSQ